MPTISPIKPNPTSSLKPSSTTLQTPKQQLKQLILQNQNSTQKGYYTYQQWKSLNSLLFTLSQFHLSTTIINCWRILKLINFGDDFIPTGLIYDTIMTLINVDQTVDQTEILLKKIFFKFIQFNGKFLSKEEKQELIFFKLIRNIVEGYRKIIAENLQEEDEGNNNNYTSTNTNNPITIPSTRNQQLYRLHNVFVYKKNLQKLKKIQTQFKQCTFQPKINQYSQEIGQSRYRENKNKSNNKKSIQNITNVNVNFNVAEQNQKNKFGVIYQSQQYQNLSNPNNPTPYLFKASPVPSYPQFTPYGLTSHLQRMQRSRQILKINSLNNSLKKLIPGPIQQFTINQRTQQRKKHKLQNCKILFNIKVEVGKRLYRIKVRQNMTVNQTVQAIQKMVGFKDKQIWEVVKGYFINWEKREEAKRNEMIIKDQLNSSNRSRRDE